MSGFRAVAGLPYVKGCIARAARARRRPAPWADPLWRALSALAWLAACSPPDRAREATDDAPRGAPGTSAAAPATASPAPSPRPWYRRQRTLDLTGDGIADTVRLEARGARRDSLAITLTIHVRGAEAFREGWGSSYELALADSAPMPPARRDSLLRRRLDDVLASVVVQELDAPGVRLMREDSATLAGLAARPTQRVSFAYGYESTVRLVWDASRSRFVRLWSCC